MLDLIDYFLIVTEDTDAVRQCHATLAAEQDQTGNVAVILHGL